MDNNFKDFKNEELYTNEGDICPECGGQMFVSFVTNNPEDAVKTWTCETCGLTESE